MYPYVLKNSSLHYFDDLGVLFTNIGNYILNDVEVYMMEKFNGKKSVEEIVNEISVDLESDDKDQIKNIVMEFINSKPDAIFLSNQKNPEPLRRTGIKNTMIPLELTISLTNRCNLKCIHCFKKCSVEGQDFLPFDKLMSTLKFLKDKSISVQLTGGEPMLHPDFYEILDYSIKNFETVITTTGTLINTSNVDKFKGISNVQLSIYSHKGNKHDAVTSVCGSFEKTINGIKELTKAGIPSTIATIVTRDNMNELEEMIQLSYELGSKLIRFGTLVPCGRGVTLRDSWILSEEELNIVSSMVDELARKFEGKIIVQTWKDEEAKKNIPPKYKCLGCGAGLFTWAISERGVIKSCEFLNDNVCPIGNIKDQEVEEIIKCYDFNKMPEGLFNWEKELQKEECSVKEFCGQIKDYYLEHCCSK